MSSLSEEWDKFFQHNPTGGPWDYKNPSAERKKQDDHIVDLSLIHI